MGYAIEETTPTAGGTEYTEDTASASNPTGNQLIARRRDSLGNETDADGDNTALNATAKGELYVKHVDPVTVSGNFGTEYREDEPVAPGVIGGQLIARRRDTLSTETDTDGDHIALNSTDKGELYVKHIDTIPVKSTEKGSTPAGDITSTDQSADRQALDVQVRTSAGVAVDSFGGGTQYTEDDASAANPVGNQLMARRRDSPTSETTTDGDVTALNSTGRGELYVKHAESIAVKSTAKGSTAAGDITSTNQSSDRQALDVQIRTSAGVAVDTFGGGTQYTEDDASAADPVGNQLLARRRDSLSTETTTDGDVTAINSTAKGELYVKHVDTIPVSDGSSSLTVDAPVGTPVNVQIGNATLTVGVIDETGASAVDALAVGGGTAHDAVDSGNPIKIGGVAVSGTSNPTSVASGDRTRFIANQHGIPYVLGGHPALITREYDFGTSAQTDVNLAASVVAADERVYVTRLEVMCDNANTVAVSARVGFGASNVPAASSSGVSGMIASHPGIAPGSGIICGNGSGIIAVGGAGEEPRITTSAATGGNTHVIISYFFIDETP